MSPIIFNNYTYDFGNKVIRKIQYAVDICIIMNNNTINQLIAHMSQEVTTIKDWLRLNRLELSIGKTFVMFSSRHHNVPSKRVLLSGRQFLVKTLRISILFRINYRQWIPHVTDITT